MMICWTSFSPLSPVAMWFVAQLTCIEWARETLSLYISSAFVASSSTTRFKSDLYIRARRGFLFVCLSSKNRFHWEIWWKVKPWAKSLMWWWDVMRWDFHLLMNLVWYELLMDVMVGLYGQLLFLRFKNEPLFSNTWTLMVNVVRQSTFKQKIHHISPYYCPRIFLYYVMF